MTPDAPLPHTTTAALACLMRVLEVPLPEEEEESGRPAEPELEMPTPALVAQLPDAVLASVAGGVGWTLDDGRRLRLAAACFLHDAWQDRQAKRLVLHA